MDAAQADASRLRDEAADLTHQLAAAENTVAATNGAINATDKYIVQLLDVQERLQADLSESRAAQAAAAAEVEAMRADLAICRIAQAAAATETDGLRAQLASTRAAQAAAAAAEVDALRAELTAMRAAHANAAAETNGLRAQLAASGAALATAEADVVELRTALAVRRAAQATAAAHVDALQADLTVTRAAQVTSVTQAESLRAELAASRTTEAASIAAAANAALELTALRNKGVNSPEPESDLESAPTQDANGDAAATSWGGDELMESAAQQVAPVLAETPAEEVQQAVLEGAVAEDAAVQATAGLEAPAQQEPESVDSGCLQEEAVDRCPGLLVPSSEPQSPVMPAAAAHEAHQPPDDSLQLDKTTVLATVWYLAPQHSDGESPSAPLAAGGSLLHPHLQTCALRVEDDAAAAPTSDGTEAPVRAGNDQKRGAS